jgi:hypothetical protein
MPTQVPTQDEFLAAIQAGQVDAKAAKDLAGQAISGYGAADAALQAQIDQFNASLESNSVKDALRDLEIAKLEAVVFPPTTTPPLVPQTFTAADFAKDNAGWQFPTGLVGRGSDLDIYQVTPGSSTKASIANATSTNPLRVVRIGAMSGTLLKNVKAQGFQALGYVGHNEHGVTIGYTDSALVQDVKVLGARGTSSSPPYETFNLELWHAYAPQILDCLIDGQGVAATLLGLNSVNGAVVKNLKANGTSVAFGAACWQCGDILFESPNFQNTRRALNFEQCYGKIDVNNPDCTNTNRTAKAPDVVVVLADTYMIEHGPNQGKKATPPTVTIREPKWDRNKFPQFIVGCQPLGSTYAAGKGVQIVPTSAITVIIDGKPYSGDQNGKNPDGTTSPVKIGNYWNG